MDPQTISTYDTHAAEFAAEWEDEQPAASDLHAIVSEHFVSGLTLDVGCGSGRDTAWLAAEGYDVTGVDASTQLIKEASPLKKINSSNTSRVNPPFHLQ